MDLPDVLVVDFGSQTANLIERRLRVLGVLSKVINPEDLTDLLKAGNPKGLILSGGPSSVYEKGSPKIDKAVFKKGIPILGICYGWQLMAQSLGGKVESGHKEYGPEKFKIVEENKLLDLRRRQFSVYMSHGDTVTKLPKGFEIIGSTDKVKSAAVADNYRMLFGLQFHPEVVHTQYGNDLLKNFAAKICNLKLNPIKVSPEEIIREIKETVGHAKVVCGVSGGIDSTVAAFLIGRAIGKNLIPVYVDSGLMRAGTTDLVGHIFTDLIESELVVINAKEKFMKALKRVNDPEEKRKIIGKLYVDLFKEEAKKHHGVEFLGQGAIYSDVIESKGSKHAQSIKSHHNVGGLPKDLGLKLMEPLRNFYKDEVREIGGRVGLPDDVVNQQPFPGPGYGVRIRGEITKKRLDQVRAADQIVIEEIKKSGLYDKIFQCFAVMTGAFSTAVKGDGRVFEEVVAFRAYESEDVMTSDWADLPKEVIQTISSRIVNEVPEISRVVYDVTTKPPATMEWE